jgi:hypothetical protein
MRSTLMRLHAPVVGLFWACASVLSRLAGESSVARLFVLGFMFNAVVPH